MGQAKKGDLNIVKPSCNFIGNKLKQHWCKVLEEDALTAFEKSSPQYYQKSCVGHLEMVTIVTEGV